MGEVIDVELTIETPADNPLNVQLGTVSRTVKARYDPTRMVGSLCYQIAFTYHRWGWNPLRWFRGPRLVHVWRAWFQYKKELP